MNKKILLIDGSAICHAVHFALPALQFEGLDTAIIYGFILQVMNLQKIHQADHIVFAWDSTESERVKMFPAYKAKRKAKRKKEREDATQEERAAMSAVYRQFTALETEVIPALGFKNSFSQAGREGDDIVASICQSYRSDNIVIVANDKDLFQLINARHVMWYLKERAILTETHINERYQIHPSRFAEMKSLAGCISDEVPGISGVGETTAIKYMCGDLKKTSKVYQRIIDSEDVIEFTRKLVELPFEGTDSFTLQKDDCTINKFKRMIRKYGFSSFSEPGYLLDFKRSFCEKTGI